ncbi:metallophosphoesterase [Aquimarina sp. I32.4]|uniref:metallophosphoesterase family protein n=1 Tax=Aquimarina sp. I32.4 TaxID=2053903 RepID=UPI000CDEB282|nr:metallophosphoesterase family protein [Aquimarina sp. I32.4]
MDKKTIALGKRNGKILLFGGVYSNLQALEFLIAIAEKKGIASENCFCTGDIVGYCAQPEETVQRFMQWGAHSIIGNVEEQLRTGAIDCGCDFKAGSRCDGFSKTWYAYAQNQLSKTSIQWMQSLPDYMSFEFASKNFTMVHGSYNHISEFIFQSTSWQIKQSSFDASNSDVIIAGHCGLPFYDKKEELIWINPGVIGMPANEGLTRSWYAIIDDSNGFSIQYETFEYDNLTANQLMLKKELPQEYAKTLLTGLWDNMEILPEMEKKLQGRDLKKLFNTILIK